VVECGEKAILSASATTCECGADHATLVSRELAAERSRDETLRPWRYARNDAGTGHLSKISASKKKIATKTCSTASQVSRYAFE